MPTSGLGDAVARLGERLGLDQHVEAIGMQQMLAVEHDADMATNGRRIAASDPERSSTIVTGSPRLSCMSPVARAGKAAGTHGKLHEARAIEAEAGAAARDPGVPRKRSAIAT